MSPLISSKLVWSSIAVSASSTALSMPSSASTPRLSLALFALSSILALAAALNLSWTFFLPSPKLVLTKSIVPACSIRLFAFSTAWSIFGSESTPSASLSAWAISVSCFLAESL